MRYRVQLHYNPKELGMSFINDVYRKCSLARPPPEKLRNHIYSNKEKGVEMAIIEFSRLRKEKVMKLTELVLGFSNIIVTISDRKS